MAGTLVKQLRFDNGRQFEIVIANLLYESVDCIVNAANGSLAHGGGVAAQIEDAAGPALTVEGNKIVASRGRIPTGEAVLTTAGNLPFKGVIHAVGPRLGDGNEENKLVSALLSSFRIAEEKGWSSLSFPGISSGIFAVPVATCARGYLRAVREFFEATPESSLKHIRLCLMKGALLEAVRNEAA
jgi:O-acetyl-ADP-ribose deacetylase (regulator of RNase III)